MTKVRLVCRCGRVLEVHPHRESFYGLWTEGDKRGVDVTQFVGPGGRSRRYRCLGCGHERSFTTDALANASREVFEAGGTTLKVDAVMEATDDRSATVSEQPK